MILSRSLVKLWAERRSGQLGSRFKVQMVLGATGVSLLPVVFLFFFSYALVNRTLNAWFPKPLENANEQNQALVSSLEATELERLNKLAAEAASHQQGEVDASLLGPSHAPSLGSVDARCGAGRGCDLVLRAGNRRPGGIRLLAADGGKETCI